VDKKEVVEIRKISTIFFYFLMELKINFNGVLME